MELLKIFIKDEVPAIGLKNFKEKREEKPYQIPQRLNLNRPTFRANYKNNAFLI